MTVRLPSKTVICALLAACAVVLVACTSGTVNQNPTGDANPPDFFPGEVVTEQGALSAGLYGLVFAIATAVFILVEGLIIFIAFRFRRRATDTALPPQTHGHNLLEIAWTVIPALVVTGLFVLSMSVLFRVNARAPAPAETIDVTGFQWQWKFEYPEHRSAAGKPLTFTGAGKEGPEAVLPVGETIRFRLHSNDVIHSFYVPQSFHKLDVVPGRVNELDMTFKTAGTFGGQCAEFCGLAHADMYFTVRAVTRAEFDAWVAAETTNANATPTPAPSGGSPPPAGSTVDVSAISITEGFDPRDLKAPADTPITFNLTNTDQSAPHNVAIRGATPDGGDWIGEPFADPGQSATYQAPPLPGGTYEYFCSIHPNMVGSLAVGE